MLKYASWCSYHPGHPQNYDEPLSWSQEIPYYFYPGDGKDEANPEGDPSYPAPHQPSGCGYFDVCPSNLSRPNFMDYCTATKAIRTMGMMVERKQPFFMGVGLIRPHLPFVVPMDMWAQYNESTIKQPGSPLPPVNYVNVSLNDQIFAGNKTFCPPCADADKCCPSLERPSISTSDDTTPFHPFEPKTTSFLRHGYYAAVSFMDEQVGRLVDRVEELGQTDNTIVIFHGDHGWHLVSSPVNSPLVSVSRSSRCSSFNVTAWAQGEQGLWTKKTVFELGTR